MKKSTALLLLLAIVLGGCKFRKSIWSKLVNKNLPSTKGWKYIIIHHSATNSGSVAAFNKHHRHLGIGGVGYHFVIGNGNGMKDGEIAKGFRWKKQIAGIHVSRASRYHNVFGIGICLVGNFEKTKPTEKQMDSLIKLVRKLVIRYKIKRKNIIGHRDVIRSKVKFSGKRLVVSFTGKKESTLCPGRNFPIALLRHKVYENIPANDIEH